jgi:TRAP transporter TAXI family solute receptor
MKSFYKLSLLCVMGLSTILLTTTAHADPTLAITKGGSNYATGIALGKTVDVIPIPHSGTTFYIPKVNDGVMDFGISNPSQLYWAYNGVEMFDKAYTNLRFVANLQEFRPVVMVRNNSELKTVDDLRGTRIPSEWRGAPLFQKNFTDLLANGGLTWDDVNPVPVATYKDHISAFANNRIDVFKGTLGGGASRKLNATIRGGVRMLCMNKDNGEYTKEWPGQYLYSYNPDPSTPTVRSKDCVGIMYNYTLWTNKDVPNDVVRDLVLKLYNDHTVFRGGSKLTSGFNRDDMPEYDRIPMHLGAIDAYKSLKLR